VSNDELVMFMTRLLVAGNETTRNATRDTEFHGQTI
jgi:cytochrome P450